MIIKHFALTNFRNYIAADLELLPGTNIFVGYNGQGKTNILEGIYYLLHGRSYRAQRDSELMRWGEHYFHLAGEFASDNRKILIESSYQERRKVMKVNGVPVRKLSEYLGTVNAVSFAPDDLTMIKGGPAERRRFLDRHLAQIKPGYIGILNSYNRALQQKNTLLKTTLTTREKRLQSALWNEQLITYGKKIIASRLEARDRLAKIAAKIYANISDHQENLGMIYLSLGKNDGRSALEHFASLLENKMNEEIERQTSLLGPHRDDLAFELNNQPSRLYASQGQQRSIVLSLKLAQLELIREDKSDYPLLLLDDVLSELDVLRRQFLLRFIHTSKIQTLLTMTNGETLPESSAIFNVEQGKIRRKK